jgi:hypothetical protein
MGNVTVPDYLAALAGWLRDAPGYYANRGEDWPSDRWLVMRDGLPAAAVYK